MTRFRIFIASLLLAAGIGAASAPVDAASSWASRCTSSYWVAQRGSSTSQYQAHVNAAVAVATARYGNFGGWALIQVRGAGGGAVWVDLHRPGTSLYASPYCVPIAP